MAKFKTYDIRLLLNGSRNNEVRKYGVTAPEIQLLHAIHGSDAIPEIKDTRKTVDRKDGEERARLANEYERSSPARAGFVRRVFGPNTIPLPKSVDKDFEPNEQMNPDVIPADLAERVEANAALM